MKNAKLLANAGRLVLESFSSRKSIGDLVADWNFYVEQACLTGLYDFPTEGYTRKAQVRADLERCIAQLDAVADRDARFYGGKDEAARREAFEQAHAEALVINLGIEGTRRLALYPETVVSETEAHAEALVINLGIESAPRLALYPETVVSEADAHAEARRMNRYIGNADLIPQSRFSPVDQDYLLSVNARLHPELLAYDIREAHAEALAVNRRVDELLQIEVPIKFSVECAFEWQQEHDEAHAEALEMDRLPTYAVMSRVKRGPLAGRWLVNFETKIKGEAEEFIACRIEQAQYRIATINP